MKGLQLASELIDRFDVWVNALAAPLLPPRELPDHGGMVRLEFRHHVPHAVMVGKCVRAVSGIRAALVLAELGFITECAALLRMVFDFCGEVAAIGHALHAGGELPAAVQKFVDQYFTLKPRTPQEHAAAGRARFVSREELLKAEARTAPDAGIDRGHMDVLRRFLNMSGDAYVHGAYETAMELCDPTTGRFLLSGHPSRALREEFIEEVLLKSHEVVVALELTAAVTGHAEVFQAARDTRHMMDASDPWKLPHPPPPTK